MIAKKDIIIKKRINEIIGTALEVLEEQPDYDEKCYTILEIKYIVRAHLKVIRDEVNKCKQ